MSRLTDSTGINSNRLLLVTILNNQRMLETQIQQLAHQMRDQQQQFAPLLLLPRENEVFRASLRRELLDMSAKLQIIDEVRSHLCNLNSRLPA